ncbi:MAG: transcriptional repressor [Bacteroidaceae bacterium]|jgi:Fur family ferric uptake transcriptional regulator|nr:transcriptional repressor [Bacteroidaceae bacterium]
MASELTSQTMEQIYRQLEEYLHDRELRVTPERKAIVDAIYGMDEAHFTIDQLGARLEAMHFRVAQATLYNNMEMLMEAGLIWRHYFGAVTCYEASYGVKPHFHCICRDCGMVMNLTNERLTSRLAETRVRGFKPDDAYIYLYGLCTKCGAARRRKINKLEKRKSVNCKNLK